MIQRGNFLRVVLFALMLAVASGSPVPGTAGESTPTHGEVMEHLMGELMARIAVGLPLDDGSATPVILRPLGTSKAQTALEEWVTPVLEARGYSVWQGPLEPELFQRALVFEYRITESGITNDNRRRRFLSLGPERVERVAGLGIEAKLRDPRQGLDLWSGKPEVSWRDWVGAGSLPQLLADAPEWAAPPAKAGQQQAGAGASNWVERAGAAALLGTVILLYAAGAN